MNKRNIVVGLALTALLWALPVWAGGDRGLGIYMGGSRTTMTPNNAPEFDSSGPGLGIDFQFPVGESFSINPFFLSFKEEASNAPLTDAMGNVIGSTLAKIDNTIAGLQLRYWLDGVFLGVHAGKYRSKISFPAFAIEQKNSDTGFGTVIGWEGEGGFTLVLQYDTVTYDTAGGAEVEFKSLRGLFGYRF